MPLSVAQTLLLAAWWIGWWSTKSLLLPAEKQTLSTTKHSYAFYEIIIMCKMSFNNRTKHSDVGGTGNESIGYAQNPFL